MPEAAQKKQTRRGRPADIPPAEWAVAALGLVLVLCAIGFMLYHAITSDSSPPDIVMSLESVRPVTTGYVATVRVTNRGSTTAASLQIEALFRDRQGAEQRGEATVDYVAPRSSVTVGVFFRSDPRTGDLRLRALGYTEP